MTVRYLKKTVGALALLLSLILFFEISAYADTDCYSRVLSSAVKSGAGTPDYTVRLDGKSFYAYEGERPSDSEYPGGIVFTENTDEITYQFDVSAGGLYNIAVEYFPLKGSSLSPSRKLIINGELPFTEASKIVFDRLWKDSARPVKNSLGDDVCPIQKEVSERRVKLISDDTGLNCDPLEFLLNAGKNTVTLKYIGEPLEIDSIELRPVKTTPSYNKVKSVYDCKNATNAFIIEAEDSDAVTAKSEASVISHADSDPSVTPYEATHLRLNTIGGYSWVSGHQEISWKLNVPETGLYKLHFRYKQNWNSGLPSYRSLRINGELPFSEMKCITFKYGTGWQDAVPENEEGEPYLFELKKGENIISMRVEFGENAEIIQQLKDTAAVLRELIFDITRITGYTPDPNYNYSLETEIPDLTARMNEIYNGIRECRNAVHRISAANSTMEGNLKSALSDLEALIKRPTFIPNKLEDLNTMLTNLSDWSATLQTGPLSLDTISLLPPDEKVVHKRASFFQKLRATFENFSASFVKDYNAVSAQSEAEAVDVWISRGKEWAQLTEEAAASLFTKETGLRVNFHILPSGVISSSANPLLLALSSGITPDAVLGLSYDLPVEYAFRNVVADLTEFEDFEDVKKRFLSESMVPFTYDGSVFALPETISFRVMYYRTDIFERLKIKVPETWQELYDDVVPVLSRNNMKIYVPQILDLFLYQHGGNYYTEDGNASALGTPEAYSAFKELCELYTENDVPVSANFYNRFRTGEIPLGIENASQYLLFSYAAPDIAGNWEIAPIPGHTDAEGRINRSNSGTAQDGCIILKNSAHKNEAWEFLKWWTSAKTQKHFSDLVEGRIGSKARWLSANTEAFFGLPWSKTDRVAINSAFENLKETPVVLGSYFANRHLTNAINRTVIQGQSARDSLEEAVEQINLELSRRQKGYYKRQAKYQKAKGE